MKNKTIINRMHNIATMILAIPYAILVGFIYVAIMTLAGIYVMLRRP